jgi:hypothetical protein
MLYLDDDQLEKGLPGDPRFPERDNEYVADMTKRYDLLAQWTENFRAKFGQYAEAEETLKQCEELMSTYDDVIVKVKIPLDIQVRALEISPFYTYVALIICLTFVGCTQYPRLFLFGVWSRLSCKAAHHPGKPLMRKRFCLDMPLHSIVHLTSLKLDRGMPADQRFPERAESYFKEVYSQQDRLLNWLESFRAKFGRYPQAAATICEVEAVLERVYDVVGRFKIPHAIEQARNSRETGLEYGLEHHLERFCAAVGGFVNRGTCIAPLTQLFSSRRNSNG